MSENKYRTMLERVADELGDSDGVGRSRLYEIRAGVLAVLEGDEDYLPDNQREMDYSEDDDLEPLDDFDPVYVTLHFYYNDPDSMRRMRECLDAPRWKSAVWEFDNWLRNQIKYSDHAQAWIDAFEQVRVDFNRIFYDHGIDIWEE